ncbi:MAG TPA: response regulator [Planktothrix sp.]|jgi:CheY-like chemotaxis protein
MSGKILALEEDRKVAMELSQALETPGHHLIHMGDIGSAVECLQENHIDLVACDIHLRSISAFEFLKEAKSIPGKKDVPFVFYSIDPSEFTRALSASLREAAIKLGAADLIVLETFEATELCRAIERHLPAGIERRCA